MFLLLGFQGDPHLHPNNWFCVNIDVVSMYSSKGSPMRGLSRKWIDCPGVFVIKVMWCNPSRRWPSGVQGFGARILKNHLNLGLELPKAQKN